MKTAMESDSTPSIPLLTQSSTSPYSTMLFFGKQLIWTTLGLLVMLLASWIDYPRWQKWAWPIAIIAIGGLILVWTPLGKHINGATSWLNFKYFTIQPAEFAKVALIIFLADQFARKQDTLKTSLPRTLLMFIIPAIIAGMVISQPDLGMAMLMILLIAGLWFLAGLRIRQMVLLILLGTLAIYGAYKFSDNARGRIDTFLHPEKASKTKRYQMEQAQLAMASGGLWGVGLGDGRQKMHFLPACHTDFVFAVLAEELGFITCVAVLFAYGGLLLAGFYVAKRTPDLFGTFLAGGLTLMLGLGVLINIAVVTNSMPTTGLPLPLLSYGGSSLLSTMLGLGIVLNVSKNVRGIQKA